MTRLQKTLEGRSKLLKLLLCGIALINAPLLLLLFGPNISFLQFNTSETEQVSVEASESGYSIYTFDRAISCTFKSSNLDPGTKLISSANGLRCLGELSLQTSGILECRQSRGHLLKPQIFRGVFIVRNDTIWRVGLYDLISNLIMMLGLTAVMTLMFVFSFARRLEGAPYPQGLLLFLLVTSAYAIFLNYSSHAFLGTKNVLIISGILRVIYQSTLIACVFRDQRKKAIVHLVHLAVIAESVFWGPEGTFGTSQYYGMIITRLLPLSTLFYFYAIFSREKVTDSTFRTIFTLWYWLQAVALLSYFSLYLQQVFTPAFLAVSSIYLGQLVIAILIGQTKQRTLSSERLKRIEEVNASLLRMTHDLKSPLAGMKIFASKASHHLTDDFGKLFLMCFERLQEIVGHSLDYGRPTRVVPISSKEIEEILVKLVGEYKHRCEILAPKPLIRSDVTVAFTSNQDFSRLFTNLFENTIEANPIRPQIVIETKSDSSGLIIEVRDNGPGFEPEILRQISLGTPTTTKKKGTGIGLHSIRALLYSSGGRIEISNGQDRGAVFRIYFKLFTLE